eukprot:403358806
MKAKTFDQMTQEQTELDLLEQQIVNADFSDSQNSQISNTNNLSRDMMIPEDLNEFFNEKSIKENKGKTGQGILQLKQASKIENKQTQSSQDNLQVNHKNPIATTSNQNEKNLVNLADKR